MAEEIIKVALIDDDRDDQILIKDLLSSVSHEKYDLQCFSDSQSGLEALNRNEHDVYLIDYRLDIRTDLDLLEDIDKKEIKRRVILLTGNIDRDVDVAGMNRGASDFLPKELMTPELLERSIRYCIKRSQDLERLKEIEKFRIEKESSDKANSAKSLFLANMSHEIRTPLGAMMGFAELALEPGVCEEDKNNYLRKIKRNGEHLSELINDILDLSKVEAGQLQIDPIFFNWREVLFDIVEALDPKIKTKPIELKFGIQLQIPKFLKGDPQRFRQMLMNIVGNAIKFTSKGDIKVDVSVQEGRIVFDISDTGIGISTEDKKSLFRPFQQANSSLSRQFGGTGLGLDLSRKLARAHQGDLQLLSSELGVGTTFRLVLPAIFRDELEEIPRPQIEQNRIPLILQRNLKILLAEDTLENQFIVKCFLKGLEVEIDCVENGEEALKKVNEKPYDLILMDIQMPILDGFETTKILRRSGFVNPILALTAHAFSQDREKALQNGFTGYLTKPLNKSELQRAIENIYR